MAAGKEKHKDANKKHVTFENIEALPQKIPLNSSNGGLLLHVKGNGKLCIRSSSLDNENGSDIDILLKIKNKSNPVTLLLPQEQTPKSLEINGDGDIQFSIKDAGDCNRSKHDEFNDLNGVGQDLNGDNSERFKKQHRRNNSDFLKISGKDLNVSDSDDESNTNIETKDCGTDVCSADILLSDDSTYNSALTTGCFKCSNFTDITCEKCKEVPEKKEHDDPRGTDNTEKDCLKLQKIVDSVLRFEKLKPTDSGSMLSSPTHEPDWGLSHVVSLKDSIRKSYTYLLDVLDLLDLCDHLYENYVLEIDFYQKLFDMCYEPRHVRSAKRSLLMHLSTRAVRQDKLINALYGSAQYQLIPYFYPEVRI